MTLELIVWFLMIVIFLMFAVWAQISFHQYLLTENGLREAETELNEWIRANPGCYVSHSSHARMLVTKTIEALDLYTQTHKRFDTSEYRKRLIKMYHNKPTLPDETNINKTPKTGVFLFS